MNIDWFYPKNENSLEDRNAVQRALMWQFGIFAHPLYFGDYPEVVKQRVTTINQAKGITLNRLINFTDDEKKLIKGTSI